ncbi:MAG: chemotaxis protein CheC, partial [Methanomassiliicoccales archaeon]|nr:chemotaxis protein CheC [Methanomassiliicoccales archaeon]
MTVSEETQECQPAEIDAMQVDALREIGNIGAAHASTALTNLVRKEIMVDVPECFICKAEQIPAAFGNQEEIVVACFLDAMAAEKGAILLVLPLDMAKSLSDVLLGRDPDPLRQIDEDDKAAVAEIGNICASAYLSAIS